MNDALREHYERILIVDDEASTRMILRRVLEAAGYAVLEATNGREGVECCLRECPDVVLLDIRMPVMNGFDACRAIREEPSIRYTPILILTSLDDVTAVQQAFEVGATDFVTKPINWVLLAHRVRYALRTRRIEVQLRENETRLAHAQRIARLGYWRYEIAADWFNLSAELCELLGTGISGMTSRELVTYLVKEDLPLLERFVQTLLQGGNAGSETEIRVLLTGGRIRSLFISADASFDDRGHVNALFGVAQDVTDRRDVEARLSYLAHFDPVTGLPNRVLFRDRAAQAIAAAQRAGTQCAVLDIAYDPFGRLNASFGGGASDRLLQQIAERIQSVLRAHDTVSHWGGDNFAAILSDIPDAHGAASTTQRLVNACNEPMLIAGSEVRVAPAVGIALYPDDGMDSDQLLLHAGSARARA